MSYYLSDTLGDDNKMYIFLEMRSNKEAVITITNCGMGERYDEFTTLTYFHLSPDEKGWKKAEDIASALQEWINHTKKVDRSGDVFNDLH